MSSSKELLDKVVDLINNAKVEAKEQKIYILAQVNEICLNRDASLLPEVIPMVAEFQTDFNANARKYVASFMRDVVRAHPEHVALVVPVASYLVHDSNTNVIKVAILLANTIYRPALQRLVQDGKAAGAQKDWSALEGLRKQVLQTITSGPPDISMVAIKFAESVVLACVGGRGLGPGASREGDKSVQRDLSRSHPFLRADTLDQAGHALARQMVGWLGSGGGGGGKASGSSTAFGAQHYTVLINALQSLATNRAALFSDIVPALGSALESVNGKEKAGAGSGGGGKGGKLAAAGSIEVPKALQDAASSLRSACLKLLKVSPGPSKAVQRMAEAAALAGIDGEATSAVEGNPALKGRIRLPSANAPARTPRGKGANSPVPGKILALTPENRRAYANLAVTASQGNIPKPPPGYKLNRTKGFPLESLDMLFGHVLNALGPEIATASPPPAVDKSDEAGASAGTKRARSPGPDESGGSKRGPGNNGRITIPAARDKGDNSGSGSTSSSKARAGGGGRLSPMEIDDDRGARGISKGDEKNKKEESKPVVDPVEEGLDSARKAFSRVLGLWEGVAAEGKRGLHQRLVARLGRMLAEAEAAAAAEAAARRRGQKKSRLESASPTDSVVIAEAMTFMTEEYKKRFQAALALLTEMYVADVAAANSPSCSNPKDLNKRKDPDKAPSKGAAAAEAESTARIGRKRQGFELYDTALVSLLTKLSGSLEASWRQKLFTQTLLECPRVPAAALEVVCTLCDVAANEHNVQTGLVSLKDLIFHKPATRDVCIPSVLRFTYHSVVDVRTKAIRLASNLLYPEAAFRPTVEAFAKQALASVRTPEVKERVEGKAEEKKEDGKEDKTSTPSPVAAQDEEQAVDLDGDHENGADSNSDDKKEGKPNEKAPKRATSASAPTPPGPPGAPGGDVCVVGPWIAPPKTEAAARIRLSLYFALCVKSRPMFSGLLEAYVTAAPAAQAGLMAELPLLARAAAKGFGEAGVVGLVALAPDGARPLVLAVLDLLVPRETNKPSLELVTAVQKLRVIRVAAAAKATAKRKEEEGAAGGAGASGVQVERPNQSAGIENIVPVLAGLGREGVRGELPALLQAEDDIVKKAFRRLTQPAKGATYTPAELVVLLNRFNYTATGVPIKRLTRALSLCLENKTVYNYPVLREALNVMSQPPSPDQEVNGAGGPPQLPLLLMRTVMVSVTTFPELKNFVATVVLPRLVQRQVWRHPPIWSGFLRCAKMMAKESGATSFIAMVQLPADTLRDVLAAPDFKSLKDPLRHYAQTLVKVDPGVRAVLGLEQVANGSIAKRK